MGAKVSRKAIDLQTADQRTLLEIRVRTGGRGLVGGRRLVTRFESDGEAIGVGGGDKLVLGLH